MIAVRCIRNLDELNRYGSSYDEFLDRIEGLSPVYQRGWIERVIDAWALGRLHGHGANSLAFLLAERDNKLVGIAPLQLEIKNLQQLRLRRLYWLGEIEGSLGNDEVDFLIPKPEDRQSCVTAFVDHLMNQRELRWDLIDLGLYSENSLNIDIVAKLAPSAKVIRESTSVFKIDLTNGFEHYSKNLSGKMRYNLRSRLKRLQSEYSDVRFSCSPEISFNKMNALIDIHKKRQAGVRATGRKRYSLFEDPVEGKCLRNILSWATGEGVARHYWLELDDKLVAFALGFHSGSQYCYYLVAFDNAHKKYAPGSLLLYHLIENEVVNYGTQCINMMSGFNHLKKDFSNKTLGLKRVVIRNPRYFSKIRFIWYDFGKRVIKIARRKQK